MKNPLIARNEIPRCGKLRTSGGLLPTSRLRGTNRRSGRMIRWFDSMNPIDDFGTEFLAHRPIPGVRFEHNDFVRIISGEHKGKTGSLVSLNSLGKDPIFTLELESGFDIEIPQSAIERID